MNRPAVTAWGLAALTLLAASCTSSPPSPDGPLGTRADQSVGSQSLGVPCGFAATFGQLSFSNSGGPAQIGKVTLVDEHDLQVAAMWVVQVTGHHLIGVMAGYPPTGAKGMGPGFVAPGIHWATRQRADGATVPRTPYPDAVNLVLVLSATGMRGTAKAVNVYYESAGRQYLLNLRSSIELFNDNSKECLQN